jgi:predicted peroxiredoxin
MANPLIFYCSHGKEDPERAILPFIAGNVAVTANQQATIFLTIDGVWLATKGYAEGVNKEGFTALKEIMNSFISNGGKIWACGACAKPRGITENDMIEGAKIVTAANLVEQIVNGSISCTL